MHTASCRQELTQAHLASSCSSSRRPATQHAGMQQYQTGPCHTPAQSSRKHPACWSPTSQTRRRLRASFPNSGSDWGRINRSVLISIPGRSGMDVAAAVTSPRRRYRSSRPGTEHSAGTVLLCILTEFWLLDAELPLPQATAGQQAAAQGPARPPGTFPSPAGVQHRCWSAPAGGLGFVVLG